MREVMRGDGVVLAPDYSAALRLELGSSWGSARKGGQRPQLDHNNCLHHRLPLVSLHLGKMPWW